MPVKTHAKSISRRGAMGGFLGAALAGSCIVARPTLGAAMANRRVDSRRLESFIAGKDPALQALPEDLRPREGSIAVPRGALWYRDTGGSGTPVVLVHATTGTARSWDYQMASFSAAGYRVIAYSRRGTAQSATSVPPDNLIETTDLHSLVASMNLRRFHLVGTASGGFIAVRYAVAYPETLLTLTLCSSLLGLNEPSYSALLERLLPPSFNALSPDFKELSPSYRVANPEGTRRWLDTEADSVSAQLKTRPDMQAAMRAGLRGGGNGPTFADLRALPLSVHLIYGDADLYSPPSIARTIMPHFAQARLTVLGEAGHAAYWEQPDNFNNACKAFWRAQT